MALEREQLKILVKAMKAVYTKTDFIPDQDAFDVWYAMLKDLDYKILTNAIQSLMMTSPFPPTIADVRNAATKFMPDMKETEMPELEAWGRVKKAIRNATYNAQEEYDRLPVLLQRTVGSPANLTTWAQMDSETLNSVEQSHFLRAYRTIVEREKELRRMSPVMQKLIAETMAPALPEFMPVPDID